MAAKLPKKCCEKVSVEENAANKDFDTVRKYAESNSEKPVRVLMRDMVEESEPYPLDSWKIQFDRIRLDLEDALNIEARITPTSRRPDQQKQFAVSLLQFWNSANEMFAMARAGPSTVG